MHSILYRPRIIGIILLVLLVLALLFTALLVQASQTTHRQSSTEYRVQTITYCSPDNIPQRMDIYMPATVPSGGLMPVVERVHGGAWIAGGKGSLNNSNSMYPEPEAPTAILGLLAQGFVVTSINYRLAPQFKFPANIEDVKCSIRYLRAHAAQYHIDPNRIGLMGESAGGHLVSLAGLTGPGAGWDVGEYIEQSSMVQAVVDMFGPEYLASGIGDPIMHSPNVFGNNPRVLQLASPPTHIASTPNSDPPFLILQGDKDMVVPPYHSLRFYNQLLDAGQSAILQMVQNAGHDFIPRPQSATLIPSPNQISTMIVQFFVKHLAGRTPTTTSTNIQFSFIFTLYNQNRDHILWYRRSHCTVPS